MFKLIHKNRKGVSLVELLVCLAVLGLVLPLAGNVLYNFINFNNVIIDRWDVQAAVKLACGDFENNKDGMTSAYQLDLIYDPVIEEGVILDRETGYISWKNNAEPIVINDEGIAVTEDAHKDDVFTYIFSAKTWDTEGAFLGELLYMRSYGDTRSHLLLSDYGMGNIPVSVTFSVGTTENMHMSDDSDPFYTKNTVTLHFRSGKEDVKFGYDTSFVITNLYRNINYTKDGSALISEEEWLQGVNDDDKVALAYTAGWDNYNLNYKNQALVNDNGFPKSTGEGDEGKPYYTAKYRIGENGEGNVTINETMTMEYVNKDGSTKTVNDTPVIAREANILRYKSPLAEREKGEVVKQTTGAHIATCLVGFSMVGSNMRDQVLGNIRMFRDNVLRGTEFGDWFIHQYYYVWSPFLIEHTAFLKPVYQAILIPVSYVCKFIAKL